MTTEKEIKELEAKHNIKRLTIFEVDSQTVGEHLKKYHLEIVSDFSIGSPTVAILAAHAYPGGYESCDVFTIKCVNGFKYKINLLSKVS